MWTRVPLILRVDRKGKNELNIFSGTLDIVSEQDWPVDLGATLDDGQKIKNNFSSFRDFSGESQ